MSRSRNLDSFASLSDQSSKVRRIAKYVMKRTWCECVRCDLYARRRVYPALIKNRRPVKAYMYGSVIRSGVKLYSPCISPREGWPCNIWRLHPPIVSSAEHSPRQRQNGKTRYAKARTLRVRVCRNRDRAALIHVRIIINPFRYMGGDEELIK